jgi:hypothetical protein
VGRAAENFALHDRDVHALSRSQTCRGMSGRASSNNNEAFIQIHKNAGYLPCIAHEVNTELCNDFLINTLCPLP